MEDKICVAKMFQLYTEEALYSGHHLDRPKDVAAENGRYRKYVK